MHSSDLNYDQIPLELRERSQWVVMCLVKDIKTGKLKKVPYQCNAIKADVTEASTWATFAEVIDAFKGGRYDGIGYVFTEADPYVGVDLDGGRDRETGRIESWAQEIIDQLDTYTELSVSGTGFHCLVKATKGPDTRSRIGHLEIYESLRYFVVTGNHVEGSPLTINDRQEQLESVMSKNNFVKKHSAPTRTPESQVDIPLTFDAKIGCPVDAWELIKSNTSLQSLWRADTPLKGQLDKSPSVYGFMLLGQLATKGIAAQSLLDTLIAFRSRVNARYKPETWYRDEVAKVLQRSSQMRKPSPLPNDSLVGLAFRHLRQEPDVKPIDFCVLAVLALATRDGDTARVSVKEITAQLNMSEEHVQRHLRKLEGLGCIVVVETARRYRPKLYRFALSHVPP
jgi:hypothetical protein